MSKAIGIDLGTTNSVVAVSEGGETRVLLNLSNDRCTRSVVGLHKKTGEELIGVHAVQNAPRNPENTIFSVKRLMGKAFDDDNVQRVKSRYEYRIVQAKDGSADVRVMLGDQEQTPTDISAKILRKLKEDAEVRLGEPVTHAVITVPAYFTNLQRICTRAAGEQAGLRVKAIIDEPTAAAIAFGVDQHHGDAEGKHVLVYDLGGGTFDVSVLFAVGDASFNQMAIDGDMWLGGDDFDHKIMDYVLDAFKREHGVDPSNDKTFMLELKEAAEKAKVDLSEMNATSIVLVSALRDNNGDRMYVEVDLSRSQFNSMIRDQVENHSLGLLDKALQDAELSPQEVDYVLLVGGSSTVPLVQAALAKKFGEKKLIRNVDVMTCVAVGAAILAERVEGLLCTNKECQDFNSVDAEKCKQCGEPLVPKRICNKCGKENDPNAEACAACGASFRTSLQKGGVTHQATGIEAQGGGYEIIVRKSTPYPTPEPVTVRFRTAADTQKAVLVPVYHGGKLSSAKANEWLGTVNILLEGLHLAAGTPVDVAISIDADGCLDIVAAIQDGSGKRERVFIDPRIGRDGVGGKGDRLGDPGDTLRADASVRDGVGGRGDRLGDRDGVGGNGERLGDEEEEMVRPTTPEWQNNLMWSIIAAGIALEEFTGIMEHRQTQKLQGLVKEGRRAIEEHDEASGRLKEKELDAALEEGLGGLMILLHAAMRCLNPDMAPGTRNEIRTVISDIVRLIKEKRPREEVERKVERLVELLAAARNISDQAAETSDKATRLIRA